MSVRRRLLRVCYHYPANFVSWVMFAAIALILNVISVPMLLFRSSHDDFARNLIRRLFKAWCAWLRATQLIFVRFHGFTSEAMKGPAVYISNHPGLLDATFILSQLPDAICIFKPEIMRNPVLGPAARMAGYASGSNGVDLIRDVATRLSAGRSLLVFPEGTRTMTGKTLNSLRPGFALIARRAQIPIRMIIVRAPADLVPKGWRWWCPPRFPALVDITLVGELPTTDNRSANALTEAASRQFSAHLARNDPGFEHASRSHS